MARLAFLVLFAVPLSLGHIKQCPTVNEKFLRGWELFGVAAKMQLADKPIPDMNHWRLQRIETIRTLKELVEKLDNACFYTRWATVVDSAMSWICKLTYLADLVRKFLNTYLYNLNVSDFRCPAAIYIEKASSILESILSSDSKHNLNTVLKNDREISLSLNNWFQSVLKLQTEVRTIPEFSLNSKKAVCFILLNELNIFLNHTQNPREAVNLIKEQCKNIDNYIEDFLRFSIQLENFPLASEKNQFPLSILNTLIRAANSGFEDHQSLREAKMFLMISFISDKLDIETPLLEKSSTYILPKVLDIAKTVTSFKDSRNIVKNGDCVYSECLKHIVEILELELTFMESSIFQIKQCNQQ